MSVVCGRDSDTQLACLQTVIDDSCTDDSVYHNSLQNIANSLSDRCGKSCSAHARALPDDLAVKLACLWVLFERT